MQKYGHLANAAVKAPFKCLVCETISGFNWSDAHGEAMCNKCGVPYNLKADPPECNLKPDWILICKQYFQETGAYMGLGQIMIWDQYPECEDGVRKFNEWVVKNHPELCKPREEESDEHAN